jgi:hypothetical protein
MQSRLGAASKNAVMAVVALVIFAVAGVVAYQALGPQFAESAHRGKVDKGNEYRMTLSKMTAKDPQKFNSVSMLVGPDEWSEKAVVTLEIGGRVPNQAALDDLKKLVEQNPSPVPVEWKVKVGS